MSKYPTSKVKYQNLDSQISHIKYHLSIILSLISKLSFHLQSPLNLSSIEQLSACRAQYVWNAICNVSKFVTTELDKVSLGWRISKNTRCTECRRVARTVQGEEDTHTHTKSQISNFTYQISNYTHQISNLTYQRLHLKFSNQISTIRSKSVSLNIKSHLRDERAAHELEGADAAIAVRIHTVVILLGDGCQEDSLLSSLRRGRHSHLRQ